MRRILWKSVHLAIALRRLVILTALVVISFHSLNPWHAAIVLLGIILACDFAGEQQ